MGHRLDEDRIRGHKILVPHQPDEVECGSVKAITRQE
jgi:hypothetical protein